MRNLFNGFSSPRFEEKGFRTSKAKVLQSDGTTIKSVPEPVNPFPPELTADAFSIKSLQRAGVPIEPTAQGKIPATPEQIADSAMRYGRDLTNKYEAELLEAERKKELQEKVTETTVSEN